MEKERGQWLRRRLLWYCGFSFALGTLPATVGLAERTTQGYWLLGSAAVTMALSAAAFVSTWRSPPSRAVVLRVAAWLYVLSGAVALVGGRVGSALETRDAPIVSTSAGAGPGLIDDGGRRELAESRATLEDLRGRLDDVADRLRPLQAAAPEVAGPLAELGRLSAEVGAAGESLGGVATPLDGRGIEAARVPQVPTPDLRAALRAAWRVPPLIFLGHLVACLVIPWTGRESVVPGGIVFGTFAVLLAGDVTFTEMPAWAGAAFAGLAGLALVPGTAWCYWRYRRFPKWFRTKYESLRYKQLSGDLDGARKIHESVLPAQRHEGPLRLSYVYEPMSQIGGDLLYVRGGEGGGDKSGPLTTVLLDVTGHGIAAALTVNRLLGELDRTFAENPDAGPGQVLARLNDYVHLTLSTHAVYVTGLAVRLATQGDGAAGRYANAGHPPAFLRKTGGDVDLLHSTTFMLGVLAAGDFEPRERPLCIGGGDVLLLYTDGAAEARDDAGTVVGTHGLRDWFADAEPADPRACPEHLLRRIARHRGRAPDDDTLIAAVYRGESNNDDGGGREPP